MPSDEPRKLGTFFYMHDWQHDALRAESRTTGEPMSRIIREGIDLALAKRKKDRAPER